MGLLDNAIDQVFAWIIFLALFILVVAIFVSCAA